MFREFTLKAVINKEKTRVLFAEVDVNLANVLLSFSTLPLRIIVQALEKHYGDRAPVIGSLNNLYHGLTKFSTVENESERLFKKHTAYKFPSGETHYCSFHSTSYPAHLEKAYFCVIRTFLGNTSFFIRDDMRVVADGKASVLDTLKNVGVAAADMDGAQTRNMTLGVNEVMDFLVKLLICRCPLTDFILGTSGTGVKSEVSKIEPEAGTQLHHLENDSSTNHEKMVLKLMIQKSTNTLLFAQADKLFISYLYSLLVTPLGRVDSHLGGNTCLYNICNLYRSLTSLALDDEDIDTFFLISNPFKFYGTDMFMVTNDFTISSLCLLTSLSGLDELKIPLSDVKELDLKIGFEEVISFLKTLLTSTSPFTDGLINPGLKSLKILQKPKQEN